MTRGGWRILNFTFKRLIFRYSNQFLKIIIPNPVPPSSRATVWLILMTKVWFYINRPFTPKCLYWLKYSQSSSRMNSTDRSGPSIVRWYHPSFFSYRSLASVKVWIVSKYDSLILKVNFGSSKSLDIYYRRLHIWVRQTWGTWGLL